MAEFGEMGKEALKELLNVEVHPCLPGGPPDDGERAD